MNLAWRMQCMLIVTRIYSDWSGASTNLLSSPWCYGFSKLTLSMPTTRLRLRLVEDKNDY